MKILIRITSTLCLLLLAYTSRADIGAGEVTYQWLTDSTYRVFFKAYIECSGVPEPSTVPLCITNTCTTTSSTATMNKLSAIILPPPNCTTYPTRCTQLTSNLPGYKEVIYSVDITLPSRCNDWRFSTTYGTRAANLNLAAGSFYAEASINNTGSYQGNSSPYFNNKPIAFVCAASAYSYNSNAIDPNGDSLATDVINVKTSVSCGNSTANTLNSSSPSLQIPHNPFQTNNSMTCNSITGELGFTPAALGENVCAIRTRKFRSGVLISYVTRELRFITVNCSTIPYSYTISSYFNLINCALNGPSLVGCPGTTMSYSMIIAATDTNARLNISKGTLTYPGSTVTYTNQNTDSVMLTFTWPVPFSAMGVLLNFIYTINDVTCQAPGIPRQSAYTVPWSVATVATATADTFICQGKPLTLSGGNNWSIVSGSPGSLSCTTCMHPVATPTIKSSYMFTVPACPNMGDTIIVDVKPITSPALSISTSPGLNIITGMPVTFTATTSNCTNPIYQWKKNGISVPGAISATYNTSTLANGDIIACQLTCNDTCPNPKVQTQQVTMIVTNGVAKLISESDITIAPNPNNGIFTISTQAEIAEKYNLQVYNNLGQSVYKTQTIILSNGNNKQIDLSHLPAGIYTLMLNETPYKITITK